MLVPSLFNTNFVDAFFNDNFDRRPSMLKTSGSSLMNTDIREFKDHYEMELELPGYQKENIHATLKDGYLTIDATREETQEEGTEAGVYLRRERYVGKIERTFFVGEDLKETDIKAGFENGILKVNIPKVEYKPEVEEAKNIFIE
ncbi:MAG: Hsp20/alpha crystallin family protein [Lachnospiraceae bacterium]|nr:Hsp20/alpha crystallin family protein [Lachnospiraceae bacterium]